MTQLSDDDNLVTFVKTYYPVVPPASQSLENQVMREILQQNRSKPVCSCWRWWGLGTIITAGLALSWTMWPRSQLSPQIVMSPEEIETFLVEGWQGTMAEPIEVSSSSSVATDWLLLGNLEDY